MKKEDHKKASAQVPREDAAMPALPRLAAAGLRDVLVQVTEEAVYLPLFERRFVSRVGLNMTMNMGMPSSA